MTAPISSLLRTGLSVAALVLAGSAQALVISDQEPNNSLTTAQSIDAFFSLDHSEDIGNEAGDNTSTTIPHVTIEGTGDGTNDYFVFTVANAGVTGIFDIDYGLGHGGSIDTVIGLWAVDGSVLDYDDDSSTQAGAGGSVHDYDSFIQHTFAAAGQYIIGVGECCSSPGEGGWLEYGNKPDNGDTYVLQVSIEGHALAPTASVPEATSIALIGIGLLGMCVAHRRKA